MTNFSAGRPQRSLSWFTPERAVVLLPILLGLGLASMVLFFGFTPLSVLVRDRQATVDQLKLKRDAVPGLRAELDKLLADQTARQKQQDQLLGLIAGTSELSTFLAELNQLALAETVTITATAPGEIERYVPPPAPVEGDQLNEDPPAEVDNATELPPADPLLRQGLEKRSASITVQGPFERVLDFLRGLERLQVFVIIEDLSMEADLGSGLDQTQSGTQELPRLSQTTMALTLTAYGRSAVKQPDSKEKVDSVSNQPAAQDG